MKRATLLLIVLGLILVVAAWFMLMFQPSREELAAVETQIVDVQAQQATTRTRIVALQGVREQAPQLQAELAAAESLLPRDTALPSALRQLQAATDAAGATLVSVAPARPEPVEGAAPELFAMAVNAELRGNYFQMVDVLRRLEDPAISPRGMVWDSAAITVDEDAGAPAVITVLTGRMFAVLPAPPAPDAGTADPATSESTDGAEGTDADQTGGDAEGEEVQ